MCFFLFLYVDFDAAIRLLEEKNLSAVSTSSLLPAPTIHPTSIMNPGQHRKSVISKSSGGSVSDHISLDSLSLGSGKASSNRSGKNAGNVNALHFVALKAEAATENAAVQEKRELLGDALFKRAQAKLMLHQLQQRDDLVMLEGALADAKQV